MKKIYKILIIILLSLIVICASLLCTFFALTKNAHLDINKLENYSNKDILFDINGEVFYEFQNGKTKTDIKSINDYTIKSFISIEDKRFYKHNGVDIKGLTRAFIKNIKSNSFKEGGSTITQQLIKNTHLSNEKTVKRKLSEIKLSLELEKKYSKNEILEMYLSTIYFGENAYGIENASKTYFNKQAKDLTINESATLAGIIKAPSNYSPLSNYEKCNNRKNVVLKAMYEQGYISKEEYLKNKEKDIEINQSNDYLSESYVKKVVQELKSIRDNNPYLTQNLKIYTNFDSEIQKIIEEQIESDIDCKKSIIVLTNKNQILAYSTNTSEEFRNLGSTIKPLLVYAPILEENIIYPCTKIKDEKTDFNGYSPKNFGDKYYGDVDYIEALSKSLNIPTVKLLEKLGTEKALEYLSKMGFNTTENDNNLSIALGSIEKGATITQIASAYNVFTNYGEYITPTSIVKITDNNDNVIYSAIKNEKEVFSDDTASLINIALSNCVNNGTAKKLSFLNYPIYSKTGTNGNENGNTDAYSISYTNDYCIGVWYGNKDNELLDNSITGGNNTTIIAKHIWDNIYKENKPSEIKLSENLVKKYIDKISFEEDKEVILADNIAPKLYCKECFFRKNNMPKKTSSRFSSPKIEKPILSVNNCEIDIRLCVPQYYKYKIIRDNGTTETVLCDTYSSNYETIFIDKNFEYNSEYNYYVIPYYEVKNKVYLGNKIFISTIKTPTKELSADPKIIDWWDEEFL